MCMASPLPTRTNHYPHKHLIRVAHAEKYNSLVTKPKEWKVELEACDLDTSKSPFKLSECESFGILIPPKGRLAGLSFVTDGYYLLPIICRINPELDIYDHIPIRHHFNKSWVIYFGGYKSCTVNGTQNTIESLQFKNKHLKIVIGFCPIVNPIRHSY